MEAAGLAVGVVALASLFKDCVDLFQYISAARSMGRDYEVLDTMLDVEKTILLQWAERVSLLKRDFNPLLNKPDVRISVFKVLSAVQDLLLDGRELQDRYGLQPATQVESKARAAVISGHRMRSFVDDFKAMTSWAGISKTEKKRKNLVPEKLRWIIRDKEKFYELVRQLSHFNSKLNDLIPDTHERLILMVQQDIENLHSLEKMKLVLEATTNHKGAVATVIQQLIMEDCQRRVLQVLWYRTMDLRKDQVSDAHSETYRWSLEPKQSHFTWDDLSSWLECGRGLYWISGKAGSGKSTLMKYIYENEKTHELLKRWAGNNHLIVASFFFWSLGHVDQRSQHGLLRALLYHILHAEPALIPEVLPSMWKEALSSENDEILLPFPSEMEAAFKRLASHSEKHKYCFFIDGFDEFDGRYEDTIVFLNSLVESPNFKIIISSRPIPPCEDAFAEAPKLRLHELTRRDIDSYVRATIGSHRYVHTLMQDAEHLIQDIVNKASGVFLWVVIACRSVLQGFAACDHLSDLQQRIDELPQELQDLFSHMLSKVEVRYRSQAAKLLRIRYESHLTENTGPVQTLGLAMIDDGKMHSGRSRIAARPSLYESRLKCRALEGRLRSRCCGLLEIQRSRQTSFCYCLTAITCVHDVLLDSTVEFIHRSVFEFLDGPGVWDSECLQMKDEDFDATASLAHLSLVLAQYNRGIDARLEREHFKDFLLYSRRADTSAPNLIAPILLKFEGIFRRSEISQQCEERETFIIREEDDGGHFALLFALEGGMTNFISSYCTIKNRTRLPSTTRPLLCYVITGQYTEAICVYPHTIPTSTLRHLLRSGCNPNEAFSPPGLSALGIPSQHTPWQSWLTQMRCNNVSSAISTAKIMDIFIRNNADLSIVEQWTGETLPQKIQRLLVSFGADFSKDEKPSLKDCKYISGLGRRLLRLLDGRAIAKRPRDDEDESSQPPNKHRIPAASRRLRQDTRPHHYSGRTQVRGGRFRRK